MALNKVEICGVNTAKLPILSNEEKEELFRRIKQGDQQAREEYIKGNLRLVLSVIKRFSNSNENADDLFQIGCIGLIKAIDNFDTTLDVKFSTYAVPMIAGEIKRYLRDDGILKVSRSLKENHYRIYKAREGLERKLGREPTLTELGEELKMPMEELVMTLESGAEVESLYKTIYHGDGNAIYLIDKLEDKKGGGRGGPEQAGGGQASEGAQAPGAEADRHALLHGQDPDAGGGGARDFSGSGLKTGEEDPAENAGEGFF